MHYTGFMRSPVLLALLLCSAPTLSATVLLPSAFNEIASGSQIIVHGRVSDVRSAWSDDRRRIESFVTLDASSFYRGTPAATVTFRVPGGQMGRYKSVTVGAPEFRTGEEVVLFLKSIGPSVPQVFGLNQGVFRVRVDERTGQRLVTPPMLTAPRAGAGALSRGTRDRRPLPLEQFAAQVRAVIRPGGAQ